MNKNAQDVMMSAPGPVEQKQLDELHIRIAEENGKAETAEAE
jgi:aspartyl-tRNA synthetase